MVYYGPTSLARRYFVNMGFQPATRQTTPDFLVAVTDPNARITRKRYESRVPRTADEFVEYYRKSGAWKINKEDMKGYLIEFVRNPQRALAYRGSVRADHATTARKRSAYVISIPMQMKAVVLRRLQVLKGNVAAQIVTIVAFTVQAIVVGTVFLRTPNTTATFFSRGSVLHLSVASLDQSASFLTLNASPAPFCSSF